MTLPLRGTDRFGRPYRSVGQMLSDMLVKELDDKRGRRKLQRWMSRSWFKSCARQRRRLREMERRLAAGTWG